MGIEVQFRYICDVCSQHIKDDTFRINLSPWSPPIMPQPSYPKTMGSRVLCDRCHTVLENVAVAIAPGVMAQDITAQTAQTAAPAESSTA
jgi:hypothetical protein